LTRRRLSGARGITLGVEDDGGIWFEKDDRDRHRRELAGPG
jgi:hypothetical protein